MSDDLAERIAKALLPLQGYGPEHPPEVMMPIAKAIIAIVLEEAARVDEFSPDSHTACEMQLMIDKAAAIRALANPASGS